MIQELRPMERQQQIYSMTTPLAYSVYEAALLYLPNHRLTTKALPMKQTVAMNAMKANTMEVPRVSVIAQGRMPRALACNGRDEKIHRREKADDPE